MSATRLGYLTASGPRAAAVVPLTWFVLVVSAVVILLVLALLLWGVRRRRMRGVTDAAGVPVERGGDGLRWITMGLLLSAVPLAVTLVWTMAVLAHVVGPPRRPELVIDVTGHQWWWQVDYEGADSSQRFATANEIHIPTGQKVLVRLHGADVIHSFWVPQLSGKTDMIPGQTNQSWLQADAPGIYRGQCSEYCGLEHAKMAFVVMAEPPAQFARWRTAQLQTAPPATGVAQTRGQALFQFRCSLCHAVRGTLAASHYGPDLTHLMSRRTIAAGALPNTRGSLAGWVQAPQGIKPGTLMPDQHLSPQDLQDITAYLEGLR